MALDDRARRWAVDFIPAVMPVLSTATYRRSDGNEAVQVAVKELFSFDFIHRQKMWWCLNSEHPPFGRFVAPKQLHRNPGRVPLHVAQVVFWNGWLVLDEELEIADQLHFLPELQRTSFQRYEADVVARAAYMYIWRVALEQMQPRPMGDEILLAKQILEHFNSQLDSLELDAQSWSVSPLGSPLG